MNKLTFGILIGGLLSIGGSAHAELVINEIMQSNIDCLMDEMKEFPDSWVELYNAGTETENLAFYALSVSPKKKKVFNLPARQVAPGEYVVVYCDKEETGLHASFRLESGNDGELYLWKNGGIIEQYTGMKKQPSPNVAWGRQTDGSETIGYLLTPTPGSANCGRIANDVLGDPVFSKEGIVTDTPLTVELSLPEGAPEGTVIRYTLDGTEPTASSTIYRSPLNIEETLTVRAALFKDGEITPRSVTHSYIFLGREMTMPIVSVVTNGDYFYSDELGIYNYDNNNLNVQNDWRRPINMELFWKPGEKSVLNQLCETRVKGGSSRQRPLKSLVFYANKRFGEKRFNYEFFPEDAPGLKDWKSFEMRNAGNDYRHLYMRDALVQRNMGRRVDLDWTPWQPAILMINGEYKGILNLRARSNEDFLYTFYNGLEDVTVVENWIEVKEGEDQQLIDFINFYSEPHTYEEFDSVMDVSEFCNMMVLECFHNNLDFPGNNIIMWRNIAEGSRWRWIMKDIDYGIGIPGTPATYPYLTWLHTPGFDDYYTWANLEPHTRLFRNLMDTEKFRNMFIDRTAVYMGDFMNGPVINSDMDVMLNQVLYEMPFHHELNPSLNDYADEIEHAKAWGDQRTEFYYSHFAEFYGLGAPVPVTVDKERTDKVSISINDIPLNRRWFDGKYFTGRELRLNGTNEETGLPVDKWIIKTEGAEPAQTELPGASVSYTIPQGATAITITSVCDGSGVGTIEADDIDMSAPYDVYTIDGRRISGDTSLPAGIYILKQGSKTRKIIK